MRGLVESAYEFLQGKRDAKFEEIFAFVKNEQKEEWKVQHPRSTMAEIDDDKRADLYTSLVIDGKFVRDLNENWSLVENHTYEEFKQMQINVAEQADEEE